MKHDRKYHPRRTALFGLGLALALLLCGCATASDTPTEPAQSQPPTTAVPSSPVPESETPGESPSQEQPLPEQSEELPTQAAPSEPVPSTEPVVTPEPVATPTPETEGEGAWQYDQPENHGLSAAGVEAFHETLTSTRAVSAVIAKQGVIVDEFYKDGYNDSTIFTLQSCSKSVTSALVGIAVDQGLITDLDTPISAYFPQLLESDSDYQKQITIRHLLTHTSGIDSVDSALWSDWRGSDNWVDYLLDLPMVSRPGAVFDYSTGNTHLLSVILEQVTGMSLYEFGRQYLFQPVGMDSVECATDPQGIGDGGNGFAMTILDMAKFGQLF